MAEPATVVDIVPEECYVTPEKKTVSEHPPDHGVPSGFTDVGAPSVHEAELEKHVKELEMKVKELEAAKDLKNKEEQEAAKYKEENESARVPVKILTEQFQQAIEALSQGVIKKQSVAEYRKQQKLLQSMQAAMKEQDNDKFQAMVLQIYCSGDEVDPILAQPLIDRVNAIQEEKATAQRLEVEAPATPPPTALRSHEEAASSTERLEVKASAPTPPPPMPNRAPPRCDEVAVKRPPPPAPPEKASAPAPPPAPSGPPPERVPPPLPPPPGPPPAPAQAVVMQPMAMPMVVRIDTPTPTPTFVTPRGGGGAFEGGGVERTLPYPWLNMAGGTAVMKLQPQQVDLNAFLHAVELMNWYLDGEVVHRRTREQDTAFESTIKQRRMKNSKMVNCKITFIMMIHFKPPATADPQYKLFKAGFILRGLSSEVLEDVAFKDALHALRNAFYLEE